jgi:uncharacterized repeat protein (TIGR01451 family)
LVVGGTTLVLGFVELFAPGTLSVGFNRPLASLLGIGALVQAFRIVRDRDSAELSRAGTSQVTNRVRAPAPGDEGPDSGDVVVAKRDGITTRMQEELRTTAIDVLTWYGGHSEDDARTRLRDGSWTSDEYAASFLDDDPASSTSGRLRSMVSRNSRYERNVNHTIDAIADVAGLARTPDRQHGTGPLGRVRRGLWTGGDEDGTAADGIDPGRVTIDDDRSVRRATGYWDGIAAVALIGLGIGVLAEQSSVLLAGVVGIWYAAYARTNDIPDPSLQVERSLEETDPETGESVEVTVEVTNDGTQTLPDVRLVDGVPGSLSVEEGSPRLGTLLRPGKTVEFSYTVEARRGEHEFGPLHAIIRNVPGTVEHERAVTTDDPTTMTCIPPIESLPVSVPLPEGSTRYAGTEETNAGGEGTEFYATREYRSSDPMNRIDWNRQAKTGELGTLVFREERTATVVLVIDTDSTAYRSPTVDEHAVDRSIEAAGMVFSTVLGARHRVGIAALGDGDCWLPPRTGKTHRTRAQNLLATHPALSSVPGEQSGNRIREKRKLYRRLPSDAHIMLFSPLCDEFIVRTARQFQAAGYPVTVVSPDPTVTATPGQLLERIRRRLSISDLRHSGVPVVDWAWDEPFAAALARFSKRGREVR